MSNQLDTSIPIPARPGFFRRLFRLRTLVRLLFVLLALITVWAVICAVENWRGRRAWEAYRAGAEARGTKLKLSDYLGAPLSDDENFAATPIFQNAFKRAAKEKVDRPAIQDWLSPLPNQANSNLTAPGFGSIEKNERLDLTRWRDYLLACGHLQKAGDNPAADVLLALSGADPEITALREAAKRPGSRFPVRWEQGFSALLPHMNEIRATQRLLRLRVAAELALGQQDQALADVRLMFRLVAVLEKEPVLITALVKIALLQELQMSDWEGLIAKQWREADLREIQASLAGMNQLEAYHFSFGSERAGMNDMMDALINMSGGQRASMMKSMGATSNNVFFTLAMLVPKGAYYFNKVKMNEYFDAILSRIDVAQGRINPLVNPKAVADSAKQGRFSQMYFSLFNVAVPDFDMIDLGFLFAHTQQQQAVIACALEHWRLTRGSFPDRLGALVPDYLPVLPHDVMDGQPMRYQLESDGGYKLWGIGKDAKDEQGLVIKGKNPRDQPDWVWIMPGK